jgi:hypothetical protein
LLLFSFLTLTQKIDIIISNTTSIPILAILLPTSIAAANESIKICAITQGKRIAGRINHNTLLPL